MYKWACTKFLPPNRPIHYLIGFPTGGMCWRGVLLLLLSCYVLSDSFATPWTVVHQVSLSIGFPGQEYWSGLPFPAPGNLPDTVTEPESPVLAGGFFTTELPGKRAKSVSHTKVFSHCKSCTVTIKTLQNWPN